MPVVEFFCALSIKISYKFVKIFQPIVTCFNSVWNKLRKGKEDKHGIARILFIYNCLCVLAGCFIFIFGLCGMAIKVPVVRVTALLLGLTLNWEVPVAIVSGGSFLVFTSCYGVYGTFKESRILLGIYVIYKLLFLLASTTGVILAGVYREKIGGMILDNLYTSLNTTYGFEDFVTDPWDEMQSSFHCCGVEGGFNSTTSWAFYKTTPWFLNKKSKHQFVPYSCCRSRRARAKAKCVGRGSEFKGIIPAASPPVNKHQRNKCLYTHGCYDVMMDYFNQLKPSLITILVVVDILMILSLACAIYLEKRSRDNEEKKKNDEEERKNDEEKGKNDGEKGENDEEKGKNDEEKRKNDKGKRKISKGKMKYDGEKIKTPLLWFCQNMGQEDNETTELELQEVSTVLITGPEMD